MRTNIASLIICHIPNKQKIVLKTDDNSEFKNLSANLLAQNFSRQKIAYCINIHDLNSHLIDTSQTIYTSFKQALQQCGITDEQQINYLLDSKNIDEFTLNLRDKSYANGKQDNYVNQIIKKEPFLSNQELRDKFSKIDKSQSLHAPLPRRLYDKNYAGTNIFNNIWTSLIKIDSYAKQKLSNCDFKGMVLSNTPQRNVEQVKAGFESQQQHPISVFCGKEHSTEAGNHKPYVKYVLGGIKRGLGLDGQSIKQNGVIVMFGDSIKNDGGACLNLSKQGYNTIFVLHDNENVADIKAKEIEQLSSHIPVIVVKGQDADGLTLAGSLIVDSIAQHNQQI